MTDSDRKTPDTPVIEENNETREDALAGTDPDALVNENSPDQEAYMRPKRGAAMRRATLNLKWLTDAAETTVEDPLPAVSETIDDADTPATTIESESELQTQTESESELQTQTESQTESETVAQEETDPKNAGEATEDIRDAPLEGVEETSFELSDEHSTGLPEELTDGVDYTASEEKEDESDVSSPLESEENIYEMISRIRHESTQIAPGVRSVRLSVEPKAPPSDATEDSHSGSNDIPEERFVESVIQRAAAAVANVEPEGSEDGKVEDESPSEAAEPEAKDQQETATTVVPVRPVLRYKTFAEAKDFAKHTLPLPREMQTDGQQVNYQWLMAQLKVADTPERLHELAYRLNYKDLAVLFPTLATLSKRGPTEQIQTLIRTRASSYLYYHGWVTLQFAYPRNAVAKALSDLCIQLEDRLYAFGNLIPARLGRRENRPDLGPNRMVWGDIPLISEIALPNSRHFLTDVAKAARESSYSLERFFNMYAIYDDLPLGQAILSRIAELQAGQTLDSPSLSKTFFERYRR